jgi:HAD superfamily hydrolase (TIGR01509 family)
LGVPQRSAGLGALFDWDGVIIDSSRHHEESWVRLARENRLHLPQDHFLKGFGMKNEAIIPDLLGWTRDPAEIRRLSLRKEELYREVIRERGISPLPGVREFLALLAAAAVPCAIASSTHRANIETSLEMLGLRGHFLALVTAEDVSRGKPDPEVFLKAAASLGKRPAECVVFEDAPVGIAAANAGGIAAVGVAGTHGSDALHGARLVVRRLDELDIPRLEALLA